MGGERENCGHGRMGRGEREKKSPSPFFPLFHCPSLSLLHLFLSLSPSFSLCLPLSLPPSLSLPPCTFLLRRPVSQAYCFTPPIWNVANTGEWSLVMMSWVHPGNKEVKQNDILLMQDWDMWVYPLIQKHATI